MKAKALQLGKAMSAALFVLLLSVVGMKNALAQTQVATLQHGDDISVFYGTTAFVEAHTAAADGDIVTLSSGTFTTPTITKAIILRGAGIVTDFMDNIAPTILAQEVYLTVTNDSIPFQAEGILFTNRVHVNTLINSRFTRCFFDDVINTYSSGNTPSPTFINAQFVNCVIKTGIDFSNSMHNLTFINSVLNQSSYFYGISNGVILYNSILRYNSGSTSYPFQGSSFSAYNSIIIRYSNSANACMNSTCSFFNCIGISGSSAFGIGYTSGCTTYSSYADVFESYTGTIESDETFILKDEIATSFLGSDGTQVGIHGGFMPYSNRPSYMVLKRCNVANKSTIDGKLSVEIEVVTEE